MEQCGRRFEFRRVAGGSYQNCCGATYVHGDMGKNQTRKNLEPDEVGGGGERRGVPGFKRAVKKGFRTVSLY